MVGDYGLGPTAVWHALTGSADDPLAAYFVQELRAPRVVAALAVGAALGVSGSLFQNVTGNPLGSPDILGFTTGAATGALLQIIVLDGSSREVAVGALLGGLATALAVQLLTRHAGLTGQRLVLAGLGVGAFLAAVNTLLVVRASLVAAQTAAQWLAGSLNAMLWPRALLTLVVVAVLGGAAVALARPLSQLALGDDVARASGIPVGRVRVAAVLVGVGLVSVATAATGPIAFVALAAPQIARRLAGSATPGLAGPALTGAVLVLVSDVLAQRLFAPTELAVGAVTGALGGLYLIVLLALRRNT
ncbi:MAG: iron chelate uptake ABC transporter family permease subunit, partial [Nocardioides sp.]|uniref:FecCD family ABC transporter permease n=1 Tax=Nocardioides sp. TaxID=35761 RepID=UPI0039E2DF58